MEKRGLLLNVFENIKRVLWCWNHTKTKMTNISTKNCLNFE